MKFGHFMAIVLFFVTAILGLFFYWDFQDGVFSGKILFAPIFTFFLMLVMLLFPGETLSNTLPAAEDSGESQITPFRIKVVAAMFAVTLYFYFWMKSYFTGEAFFTIGYQVSLLLSFLVMFFIVRWYIKKL
jgi:hypothetical protein